MMLLRRLTWGLLQIKQEVLEITCRNSNTKVDPKRGWNIELPEIGKGRNFRRIVHYPDEYTVKPLDTTNLAGRDPVTGRRVVKGIGGGIKHKFHWVDYNRSGPSEGPPLAERVVQVMKCGCRAAHIALVANGDRLRYLLATENMKAGDLINSSSHIPRNAVRPKEGDAHPLAALPVGTIVHCVESYPGSGGRYAVTAGSCITYLRRVGGRAVLQLPSKREVAVAEECMAVVGRVSNVMHNKIPIGSAQRNRELGNRPRSGLWQRKSGKHGRKIKRLPPVKDINKPEPVVKKILKLTMNV